MRGGLPRMPLRVCTDKEWKTLPHAMLASNIDWNHAILDHEGDISNKMWFDSQSSFPYGSTNKNFDEVGNYRHLSKNELYYFDADTYQEPDLDDIV